MPRPSRARPLRTVRDPELGFTLLEILVAIAIFAFVAAAAMQTTFNADYLAATGRRARELRMLAELKLGEVLTFEEEFDQNASSDGTFADYDEYKDRFGEWTWQVEIRDVTVFGVSNQEDAQYLFGTPTEEEKAKLTGTGTTGSGQPGASTKKSETQTLREITLRVAAPSEGDAADSVEIITFAPLVKAAAAGTKK